MSGRFLWCKGKPWLLAVGWVAAGFWLGTSLGCARVPLAAQPAVSAVPVDQGWSGEQRASLYERGQQRVYVGRARSTLGMPCGGICAGQLYVLGDGTLGCWQIDGNRHFSGTGSTSYRKYRPSRPIEQGFGIAVRDAEGRVTRATLDEDGYNAIEFVGEYPRALIRYRARHKPVPPVEVDLEVFSPFIPLAARDSAWPATVLRFRVSNPTAGPVEATLGGWLENMVFSELLDPITIQRRAQPVAGDGVTTVLLDATERRPPVAAEPPQTRVLADFESGTYAGWTVTGTAFGTGPPTGTLPNQQEVNGFSGRHLVNSFTEGDAPTGRMVSEPFTIDQPYLAFRIGGGAHQGKTCLNLVVDGRVARTATGRNLERLELRLWEVRDLIDREARLEIVDAHSAAWGHINVDDIALTNTLPEEFREYSEAALGFGNMALSVVGNGVAGLRWRGKPTFVGSLGAGAETSADETPGNPSSPVVGTVTTAFALQPGEARVVTFIVSWYFPNLHTRQQRMYTNWFRDAADVARQLAQDLDRLGEQTVRFCDSYYRNSTLPWWLLSRLMMPTANLATGTAQWWKNGRFWAWEGAYCCAGTCTHVWNYAQADAWLFPELARSTRVMQDLGEGFEETTGLVGFRSDRNFAADGQAGTILKCYREHLTSPDDEFLRKHWSRIRAALEYLISEDGDDNGVIENDRQHNTYDINFVGPNTFVGSLYLAALRAGEMMARRVGDIDAALRYRELLARGQAWTAANLFNGEYFEQHIPPGDQRPWQYGSGCLSDQVFGQTWAHLLGLGYIYPPEMVRSALAAVFRHNWLPDVQELNAEFPPERWFARPGQPGLLVCTWPRGGRPPEPVRYRDEVWTGIEYQVAAGLAWEGLVDEALTVVHGVAQRYDGWNHNPWNEVECGDHYARALAAWGVLHALAGLTFDGPAGKLVLAPRMQQDNFACFFCAGTGWGNLTQLRHERGQVNGVALCWGSLRLRRVVVELPAAVTVRAVAAQVCAGQPRRLDVEFSQQDRRCDVRFAKPVQLGAGEQLAIRLQW